jgi:tetratricopeptide (TPR) repeat protein
MRRKKVARLALILSILFLASNGPAFAQSSFEKALSSEGLSSEDFYIAANFYYMKPNPVKLISSLKILLSQEGFLSDSKHLLPFGHFIATVGHNNPLFLKILIDTKDQYFGLSRNFIQKIIEEAKDFRSPNPDTPMNLGYLWGEFIATGDQAPVMKIISVLSLPQEEKNTSLLTVAEWSLLANTYQHQRLFDIIKQAALSANAPAKEKLDKIVKSLEKSYRRDFGKYGFSDETYTKERTERAGKLIESNPQDAKNYLSRGIASVNNHNYDQAMQDFQKALALNPNLPIANNYVCFICIDKGKYDQAENYCKKAIEQSPNFSKPYFNLSRIYQRRKDYPKAIEMISKAIQYESNFYEGYLLRADIYDGMEEYRKELDDLNRALKLRPQDKKYLEFKISALKKKMAP